MSTQRKPLNCRKSLTNFMTYIVMLYRVHVHLTMRLELTTLVVIGTDCSL